MSTREGFNCYKLYLALQRHFNSDYDFFKYNGKVRGSLDSFEKRNDRFSFEKCAKIVPEDKMVDFFVANFVNDEKTWIKNMNKSFLVKYDATWKNITKIFEEDLHTIRNEGPGKVMEVGKDFPRIYKMVLQNEIRIETVIILNTIFPFVDKHVETVQVPFIFPELIKKIKKYEPFAINNITNKHDLLVDVARNVLL